MVTAGWLKEPLQPLHHHLMSLSSSSPSLSSIVFLRRSIHTLEKNGKKTLKVKVDKHFVSSMIADGSLLSALFCTACYILGHLSPQRIPIVSQSLSSEGAHFLDFALILSFTLFLVSFLIHIFNPTILCYTSPVLHGMYGQLENLDTQML